MAKLPPRLSLLTVALILVLRDQGRSFRMIAEHRRVRKKDGSLVSQQAARKVVERHKLPRRTWASWTPNRAGKVGAGGRPKVLTAQSATRIKQCIKTHRFVGVVRVPVGYWNFLNATELSSMDMGEPPRLAEISRD